MINCAAAPPTAARVCAHLCMSRSPMLPNTLSLRSGVTSFVSRLVAFTASTLRLRAGCTTSPTRFFSFFYSFFCLSFSFQERLGKSEVQLVQTMIDGVNKLIDIDAALAAGKPAPSV